MCQSVRSRVEYSEPARLCVNAGSDCWYGWCLGLAMEEVDGWQESRLRADEVGGWLLSRRNNSEVKNSSHPSHVIRASSLFQGAPVTFMPMSSVARGLGCEGWYGGWQRLSCSCCQGDEAARTQCTHEAESPVQGSKLRWSDDRWVDLQGPLAWPRSKWGNLHVPEAEE